MVKLWGTLLWQTDFLLISSFSELCEPDSQKNFSVLTQTCQVF